MSPVAKSPTLYDVAREAGVSIATVSRVLNNPEKVKPATRLSVERAVESLAYAPNLGARAMAASRTFTAGAIIPTMENSIFATFIQEMQQELQSCGITLFVATSLYDAEAERNQIQSFVSRGVDGLVLVGAERDEGIYDFLRSRGTPVVTAWVSKADAPFSVVGFDNWAAMRGIAERVLDLGHTRIAFIAGITRNNDRASARVEAVKAIAVERGLSVEIIESAYSLSAAFAISLDLISKPSRPTALICGNDVLAAGAMNAARDFGLRVPEDLSIVGFDDLDFAPFLFSPLTTVRTPHRRMGRAAARVLTRPAESQATPERIIFETKIVERESLGPPPR